MHSQYTSNILLYALESRSKSYTSFRVLLLIEKMLPFFFVSLELWLDKLIHVLIFQQNWKPQKNLFVYQWFSYMYSLFKFL